LDSNQVLIGCIDYRDCFLEKNRKKREINYLRNFTASNKHPILGLVKLKKSGFFLPKSGFKTCRMMNLAVFFISKIIICIDIDRMVHEF
jgi:hypothetical protein